MKAKSTLIIIRRSRKLQQEDCGVHRDTARILTQTFVRTSMECASPSIGPLLHHTVEGEEKKKSFVFPFHCVKSGIVSFFDSTRYCVFPLCCLFVVTTLPRGTLTAWNFPLYRITCYAMLGLRHQSINIVERPIEGGARSRMNVFTRPMGFLLLSKHEIYCCQRCARTRGPSTATTKAGTSLAERERPRFCIGKPVPFIVWYRSHGGMARGIKMKLLVALVYIRNLVPGQEEEAAFCAGVSSFVPCSVYIYTSPPLCDQHRVRSGQRRKEALLIRFLLLPSPHLFGAPKHADLCARPSSPLERAQHRRAAFDDAALPTRF